MKVFIAVVLAIGAVSARGSGPYLPSGWRPQGAAFYLPSEVATQKPEDSPLKESLLQEVEAAGSDAFREYGPPKFEELSLSANQVLPEIATEQTFLDEVKSEEVEAAESPANLEQTAAIVEQSTATESKESEVIQTAEEEITDQSDVQPTAEAQALNELKQEVEITKEKINEEIVSKVAARENLVEESVPTAVSEEEAVPLSQQELSQDAVPSDVVKAFDLLGEQVQQDVPLVEEEGSAVSTPETEVIEEVAGVNNIVEALVNLENEVKAVEVLANENVAEVSARVEKSGSLKEKPEGFLEYSPPGFAVYGPPREEDLARLAAERSSENNEVRRRRFSSKLRSTKHH